MDLRGGDDLLDRVIGELRELPSVDESQVGRIVAAATAADREARVSGAHGTLRLVKPERSRWFAARRLPVAWAAGLVLAAGVGGFLAGGARQQARYATTERPPVPASGAVPAIPVANEGTVAPLTQFMIAAPDAREVSLVGDFNGWDGSLTPLVRDPASGLWTATLRLTPGRHGYAFLVDSVVTLDPRAPESRDPDLGTRVSVVLVGGGVR